MKKLYLMYPQKKGTIAPEVYGHFTEHIGGVFYDGLWVGKDSSIPNINGFRKEIIEKFDAGLIPLGIKVLKHYTDDYTSSGHLYLTRIPGITIEQRNEIIIRMAEHGIACNVHYKPLPMHTAYKNLGFDITDYPNAYNNFANEITLPLHTKLSDDDVDYTISNYISILEEYIR